MQPIIKLFFYCPLFLLMIFTGSFTPSNNLRFSGFIVLCGRTWFKKHYRYYFITLKEYFSKTDFVCLLLYYSFSKTEIRNVFQETIHLLSCFLLGSVICIHFCVVMSNFLCVKTIFAVLFRFSHVRFDIIACYYFCNFHQRLIDLFVFNSNF